MSFNISENDIEKINLIIKSAGKKFESGWSWTIKSIDNSKPMIMSLYNQIKLGGQIGAMISVQTRHGYYELHNLTSMMFFEPDEVIFIKNDGTYLSCLIIGSENTCSLYSNIRLELLKSDFAELHPAVLLAAMQLSITENII